MKTLKTDILENDIAYGYLNEHKTTALFVNEICIPSEEALYYVCQFPNNPEIQELIISISDSADLRKIISDNKDKSRPDWNSVKHKVMDWCDCVYQIQNGNKSGLKSVLPLDISNFILLGHPITAVYPTSWYLDD